MSVDFKEVPDKTHDEILHLMETEDHIADVLCPCTSQRSLGAITIA